MDQPGAVNKKFKKIFIVTKFFILIKMFYNLEYFIFQGLIYEIKNLKIYFMDRSGAAIKKIFIVTRFLRFLIFFYISWTDLPQSKKKVQKKFYSNQILYISKNIFIFHGLT